MDGTKFLDEIARNLEVVVQDDLVVDLPREFFESKFIPYLIGEKEHPNIWGKLAELTGGGQSDIRLMNPDHTVYKVLPSIYPRSLKSSDTLEKRVIESKQREDQLAGTGKPMMTAVMANHIGTRDDSIWGEYLSSFSKDKPIEIDEDDDDDDFEIIY